jgi:hypothetical protein
VNKKYEFSLADHNSTEVGKLYIEFYDEDLNISEEIKVSKEQPEHMPVSQPSRPPSELLRRVENERQEIAKRYANKESVYDYMGKVNSVLQEGLVSIARERPEDPIKHLGLFLINYEK